MGRDKMELFARIREDHRQLGLGVRALSRKHGVHRRMVREALASPVPAPRKTPERVSPVLDSVAALIDAMLREDLDAPRKQRHTSRRIWQRLADEHGMPVSYSYVCQYAGPRRAEIEAGHRAGPGSVAGFVPQAKEPGAEAEVDFGPVSIVLAGEVAACQLFAYRLSCSGKGIHRVYACCAQEAFFEGHVTAFEVTRILEGCRGGMSGMTTLPRRCRRCCAGGTGPRRRGGPRSGPGINLFPPVPRASWSIG